MSTTTIANRVQPSGLIPKGALFARVTFTADERHVIIGRNTYDLTVPLVVQAYGVSGDASAAAEACAIVRAEGFEVVGPFVNDFHLDAAPEPLSLVALVRPTRPAERPGVDGPTWDGRAPSYARLIQHVHAAVGDVLGDVLSAGSLDAVTDRLTERLRSADYVR